MMDKLNLIFPTEEYLTEIATYRAEMLDDGCDMAGCSNLRTQPDPMDWLDEARRLLNQETAPEGWVVSTQFLALRESDGALVGMIQVRHDIESSDYLKNYGGHIGYSVRPRERRKGYATEMLRLALEFCRELGLKRVLMTCWPYNEGSKRAILNNGGVFESRRYEPYENDMFDRYWIEL